MKLDEMSAVTIESQSLEDFKSGKLIFNGFADEFRKEGMEMGELLSIGVLEGGTQKGEPSVSLLIKVKFKRDGKDDYFYTVAECTGKNFVTASKFVESIVQRFLKAKEGKESLT